VASGGSDNGPSVNLDTPANVTYRLFFFLDHLGQAPPFRIEDNTTWDTNLELAVYWGLRMIERDEELHGKSSNAKIFVLLTDGQAWSGEIARSLRLAAARQIPMFAVGVGTLSGGRLPVVREPGAESAPGPPAAPLASHLDRASLQRIAAATGGQYFELDRDSDRRIANAIVDAGKRLAPTWASKRPPRSCTGRSCSSQTASCCSGCCSCGIEPRSGFSSPEPVSCSS